MKSTKLNLEGRVFGRLTVIKEAGRTKAKKVKWLCKCTCGNEKIIIGAALINGTTKSCGCLNTEKRMERNAGNIYGKKHGLSYDLLYNVWKQMVQRCHSPWHVMFKHYGARGIFVCEEWRNNAVTFCSWAKSSGYKKGLTIDRINNDDGYYSENCRWITRKEQNINRRNTVKINGKPIVTIMNELGVKKENRNVFRTRVLSLGWPLEKALVTPVKGRS